MSEKPAPRRRWFRFSLKAMLIVVLVICIAFVPIGGAFLRLRAAKQLERLGVFAQWEDGKQVDDWDLGRSLMRFPMCIETEEADIPVERLGRLRPINSACFIGVDCSLNDEDLALLGEFRELRELLIDSSDITTDGIRSISELPHIESLQFRANEARFHRVGPVLSRMKSLRFLAVRSRRFTDNDLGHIRSLQNLEVLDLSGTSITDAGITQLRSLRRLRRLYCRCTGLTDQCVPVIATLDTLEELHIELTEVSDEGRSELRHLMPSLSINPG